MLRACEVTMRLASKVSSRWIAPYVLRTMRSFFHKAITISIWPL